MDSTAHKVVRTTLPIRSPNVINIWQQNVNRSQTCQHDLISSVVLILTSLDLDISRTPSDPPKNFCNVDWEDFEKDLSKRLA